MDNFQNQLNRFRAAGANNRERLRRSASDTVDRHETSQGRKNTFNYLGAFNSAAYSKWRLGGISSSSTIVQ